MVEVDRNSRRRKKGPRTFSCAALGGTAAYFLALRLGHHHLVGATTCCVNSTSGQALDSCTCLVDNSQINGQNLTRGATAVYHWVLDNSTVELITLTPRGNLTFKLSPCYGSARMDIKSASQDSWPYMPSFSSGDDWNPATLTISVQASEYTVLVTAGNYSNFTTFDIATHSTLLDAPAPGGGGLLTPSMPTSSSAVIAINTSATGLGSSSYRLYWSRLSTWSGDAGEIPPGCVEPTDQLSLLNNSNCLFSSVCGMERAAEGKSDWKSLSNGTTYGFEAPVISGVQYIFNVAMRDSSNITSAYRASNMSFVLTTYQECVSDPDCQSQLQDDTTIITVCASAVAALGLLIFYTTALRSSIRRTMEKATLTNTGGARRAFGALRPPAFKPSARTAEKYKKAPSPNEKLLPSRAPDGRRIHVEYEDDDPEGSPTPAVTPHAGPAKASFSQSRGEEESGDGDGQQWKDAIDEPRDRRVSTRLMKSPPSGRSSSHRSPRSPQETSRRDRKAKAPANTDYADGSDDGDGNNKHTVDRDNQPRDQVSADVGIEGDVQEPSCRREGRSRGRRENTPTNLRVGLRGNAGVTGSRTRRRRRQADSEDE